MPDRTWRKHPTPTATPTNPTAGAVESTTSRGRLNSAERYARAAQAPSPTLRPNLVLVGIEAKSARGIDRRWWPGRFVTVLGLGSRLNSSERYARAAQVLSVTPHSLLPDALHDRLPPLRRHAPVAHVLSPTRQAGPVPGSLLEPPTFSEARDA